MELLHTSSRSSHVRKQRTPQRSQPPSFSIYPFSSEFSEKKWKRLLDSPEFRRRQFIFNRFEAKHVARPVYATSSTGGGMGSGCGSSGTGGGSRPVPSTRPTDTLSGADDGHHRESVVAERLAKSPVICATSLQDHEELQPSPSPANGVDVEKWMRVRSRPSGSGDSQRNIRAAIEFCQAAIRISGENERKFPLQEHIRRNGHMDTHYQLQARNYLRSMRWIVQETGKGTYVDRRFGTLANLQQHLVDLFNSSSSSPSNSSVTANSSEMASDDDESSEDISSESIEEAMGMQGTEDAASPVAVPQMTTLLDAGATGNRDPHIFDSDSITANPLPIIQHFSPSPFSVDALPNGSMDTPIGPN